MKDLLLITHTWLPNLEKTNHIKNIGNSYATNQAEAVFMVYLGIVTK